MTGSTYALIEALMPHLSIAPILLPLLTACVLLFLSEHRLRTKTAVSLAAALLNLFITLLGVGMGPLVTGVLSDYFAKTHGTEGLRWALMGVTSLLFFTVLFFALAVNPYKQRLQQLQSA